MQARMLEDSHVALRNLADSHWIIAKQSEPGYPTHHSVAEMPEG